LTDSGTLSSTSTVTRCVSTIPQKDGKRRTRGGRRTPASSALNRSLASYVRFEADLPNECWQSDFTHYRLAHPDGTPGADCEIRTWLDDCSRYALSVTAHVRVTGPIVLATFRKAVAEQGVPASTLTDGMVFTTRYSGGKGGRNYLEHELRELNITQKNGHPGHPQTQGKICEDWHLVPHRVGLTPAKV
jgi:transposase InsO family protein